MTKMQDWIFAPLTAASLGNGSGHCPTSRISVVEGAVQGGAA